MTIIIIADNNYLQKILKQQNHKGESKIIITDQVPERRNGWRIGQDLSEGLHYLWAIWRVEKVIK